MCSQADEHTGVIWRGCRCHETQIDFRYKLRHTVQLIVQYANDL